MKGRRSTWTPEEFRHYLATGQEPEDAPARGHAEHRPDTVPVQSNKFGARKSWRDGIRFDSEVEAARYETLRDDPEVRHVDIHPRLTIWPGNVSYRADFLVWRRNAPPVVEDVKGMRPGTDFWRLKQMFDAAHPLTPLVVIRRRRGRWIRVLSREEWPPKKSAPCARNSAEANL